MSDQADKLSWNDWLDSERVQIFARAVSAAALLVAYNRGADRVAIAGSYFILETVILGRVYVKAKRQQRELRRIFAELHDEFESIDRAE